MVGTVLNWRALILSEDTDLAQGSENYCIALLRQMSILPSINSRSLKGEQKMIATGPSIPQMWAKH